MTVETAVVLNQVLATSAGNLFNVPELSSTLKCLLSQPFCNPIRCMKTDSTRTILVLGSTNETALCRLPNFNIQRRWIQTDRLLDAYFTQTHIHLVYANASVKTINLDDSLSDSEFSLLPSTTTYLSAKIFQDSRLIVYALGSPWRKVSYFLAVSITAISRPSYGQTKKKLRKPSSHIAAVCFQSPLATTVRI